MQGLYTRKKRVRYLPNVEALRKPWWMISDVHAISANTHNYRNSSWSKKFLRFLHSPNNCLCRYCFTLKSHTATLRSGTPAIRRASFTTIGCSGCKYKQNYRLGRMISEKNVAGVLNSWTFFGFCAVLITKREGILGTSPLQTQEKGWP